MNTIILSYNARIGETPGRANIVISPEADPATGWRCVTTSGTPTLNLQPYKEYSIA